MTPSACSKLLHSPRRSQVAPGEGNDVGAGAGNQSRRLASCLVRSSHMTAQRMGNIVWLASYPKSGNTWLRAFLANLIANRVDPLKPDELKNYADDEALPERFSELAGRPSHALDFGEIAALRPQVHALIAQRAK